MLSSLASGKLPAMATAATHRSASCRAGVTPAEAAKLPGVSRQYVDRLIASDVLPVRRLPGSSYRRIPARAVLAQRARREGKPTKIRAVVDGAIAAGLEY